MTCSARLKHSVSDDFGYHCLRRTCVTVMAAGVKADEETVQGLSRYGECDAAIGVGLIVFPVTKEAIPACSARELAACSCWFTLAVSK